MNELDMLDSLATLTVREDVERIDVTSTGLPVIAALVPLLVLLVCPLPLFAVEMLVSMMMPGTMMASLVATIAIAAVPYGLLVQWLIRQKPAWLRHVSEQTITMTQSHLIISRMGLSADQRFVLEDIEAVSFDRSPGGAATLSVQQDTGTSRLDLALPAEAQGPLIRLIRAQVDRRKSALEAAGHNLSTAAQVPAQLSSLQAVARS